MSKGGAGAGPHLLIPAWFSFTWHSYDSWCDQTSELNSAFFFLISVSCSGRESHRCEARKGQQWCSRWQGKSVAGWDQTSPWGWEWGWETAMGSECISQFGGAWQARAVWRIVVWLFSLTLNIIGCKYLNQSNTHCFAIIWLKHISTKA